MANQKILFPGPRSRSKTGATLIYRPRKIMYVYCSSADIYCTVIPIAKKYTIFAQETKKINSFSDGKNANVPYLSASSRNAKSNFRVETNEKEHDKSYRRHKSRRYIFLQSIKSGFCDKKLCTLKYRDEQKSIG